MNEAPYRKGDEITFEGRRWTVEAINRVPGGDYIARIRSRTGEVTTIALRRRAA